MTVASARKPKSERPSIRDVARLAQVSPGCVSNVMNRHRSQDDAIGLAVLAAVNALGYRPNAIASNLRRAQSRFIGVVVPDFENPFFGALVAALERCAEGSSYRLVATSSQENAETELRELDELLAWRVAGVLLAPAFASQAVAARLLVNPVPAVVIDRIAGNAAIDEVGVNNQAAAQALTTRLLQLGHRDLLVAYSRGSEGNIAERLLGVRAAHRGHDDTVRLTELACGPTVESAVAAFATHFATHPVPTAIFALHNLSALAALGAVQRRGLVPGRDLALASFDDSAWMAHMHPAITAMAQPVEALARVAWNRLVDRIEGRADLPQTTRLECILKDRDTLSPPARATG